jgi:hypothetical protein
MKVTRRKLAGMIAAGATVASAPAQQPASSGNDDDLRSAREQMRGNALQIAKVTLPMATEPAFQFKA